jgi:nucleoside triphosphate pyrophosphatase
MQIVLASASPRRQELLKNAGITFTVRPANLEEGRRAEETPRAFAERMAQEKAQAVQESVPDGCILGADTVVVVDDQVLGKPRDQEDAARMLRLLSDRTHEVITGVCVRSKSFEDVRSEITGVHFSRLTEAEIRDYIATGEPMDKAGAYAIQGIASRWISRIEGDYFNVVGLPVALVWRMLREHDAT